jgi:hypothetical protein
LPSRPSSSDSEALTAPNWPKRLCRRLAAGSPEPLLLDVREPWETALASICPHDGTTAIDIPMMQIPLRLADDRPVAARRLHLPSRRAQRAGRRIPGAAGLPRRL